MDERVSVAMAAYDPLARRDRAQPGRACRCRPRVRCGSRRSARNRRDDIVPPQAKVAAQLHLADDGQVGGAPARATTRSCCSTRTASWPRRPPRTSSGSTPRARCARRPSAVLLGVTRRSILELAKHDGHRGARGARAAGGTAAARRGLPHRHHRGRLARSRRSTSSPSADGGAGARDARGCASASTRSRRPGPGLRALAHRRGRAGRRELARCGSSPASSLSGEPHLGNYFGAMRQHVELQAKGEGDLLHRRLPLDDVGARRGRAPAPGARGGARLPGLRARPRARRFSTASPTCREVCELTWILTTVDADGAARALARLQGQGGATALPVRSRALRLPGADGGRHPDLHARTSCRSGRTRSSTSR